MKITRLLKSLFITPLLMYQLAFSSPEDTAKSEVKISGGKFILETSSKNKEKDEYKKEIKTIFADTSKKGPYDYVGDTTIYNIKVYVGKRKNSENEYFIKDKEGNIIFLTKTEEGHFKFPTSEKSKDDIKKPLVTSTPDLDERVTKQEKKSLEELHKKDRKQLIDDKTYLNSINLTPYPGTNLITHKSAWSTGTTLTGDIDQVDGPVKFMGIGSYRKSNPKINLGAHIITGNLEKIIKQFKATNPDFKDDSLRAYLDTIIVKDPNLISAFGGYIRDGNLEEWEFKELTKNLDKSLAVGYYYIANNKEASLPGILIITPRKKEIVSKPYIRKEPERFEPPEREVITKDIKEPEVKLEEKEEIRKIKPEEKPSLEILAGVSHFPERDILQGNFGLGIYPTNNYNLRFILSYGQKDKTNPIIEIQTPEDPITQMYGYGTIDKKQEKKLFDVMLGSSYKFSNNIWGSLALGVGIDFNNNIEKVYESIRRNNEVLAENRNTYSDNKTDFNFKLGIGPDFNFNNFRIMPGFILRGEDKGGYGNISVSF